MNVNIIAKGFDLVQGTHEGINDELKDLNKILDVDASYRVIIKKRVYGEYECTVSTYIHSRNYNVKATRKSVRASFEAAAKSLKEMVLESRSKFISKKMNSNIDDWDKVKEDEVSAREVVTKQKEVFLTPISDAEAIEELNKSDKDMFMYLDEMTLEVKGVYYRSDGYGVITFKTT